MIINNNIKLHFVQMLYITLRKCRPNFRPEEYKWMLGIKIIYELENLYNVGIYSKILLHRDEKPTLYGIEIKIDYENPYNLQLFEDITNKIAVEEEGTDAIDKYKSESEE